MPRDRHIEAARGHRQTLAHASVVDRVCKNASPSSPHTGRYDRGTGLDQASEQYARRRARTRLRGVSTGPCPSEP